MLQLVLVLLVVGVVTLSTIWRLLKTRFPHPADLATIAVFYYTLPLALAATLFPDISQLIFLHAAAANYDLAMQSIYYTLFAALCLQGGRWVAAQLPVAAPRLQFEFGRSDLTKTSLVLLGLLGVIVLGILLFGTDEFFSGYNTASRESTATLGTAMVFLSIEWLGLVLVYGAMASRATGGRVGWFAVALTIGSMLFLAAARGKRLEIIAASLPVGLLLFATRPFFRSVHGRLLTIVGAMVMVSMLASLRLNQDVSGLAIAFNFVSEGLFAGHVLPGILEKLNSGQIDYEYGRRVLAGLFAFVPRIFWPNKDEFLYSGNQLLDSVAPLGASSLVAEVVLQGGIIAVLVWFSALGFLFERVHASLRYFDSAMVARRLPLGVLCYFIIVASMIPHFRDGLMTSIKIPLQSLAFMMGVAGLRILPTLTWRVALRRADPGIAPPAAVQR